MKKEILNKINILSNTINNAKLESIKAQYYADGYLECLKDIANGNNTELLKILEAKFEGKSKEEAYSDILNVIIELSKYIESIEDFSENIVENNHNIHPNERAKKFLERKFKETTR